MQLWTPLDHSLLSPSCKLSFNKLIHWSHGAASLTSQSQDAFSVQWTLVAPSVLPLSFRLEVYCNSYLCSFVCFKASLAPRSAFRIFSLSLVFSSLTAMCLGVFAFVFLWDACMLSCLSLCLSLCNSIDGSLPDSSHSMGFSRQEYWGGLPCPPPGNLPDPGIKPASLTSPALAGGFFTTSATWEPLFYGGCYLSHLVSSVILTSIFDVLHNFWKSLIHYLFKYSSACSLSFFFLGFQLYIY